MKIVDLPLADLKPYENNPRDNDKAVDAVAASINEFGFKIPIIIDSDNIIIAGHTRLKAAQKLGLKTAPCIRADDLTAEQAKAFRLADNKTAELAEWDFSKLEAELAELTDIDMTAFGFDLTDDTEPIAVTEDEVPETAETRCKTGDIWKLGNHRLICGDSTDILTFDKLMNGEKAAMLFTSPPYSDMRDYNGGKNLSVNNIIKFIPSTAPYTDYLCINLGIQIKNKEVNPYWDAYIDAAHNTGLKLLAWNVWDKTRAGSIGQQSAFFPIRHEWIFVFGKDTSELNLTWEKKPQSIGQKHDRRVRQKDGSFKITTRGDCSHSLKKMESVVSVPPECGKITSEHPAVFPVKLPAEYIQAMTDENDIVIEPFGGSGTTMIACEELGRQCRIVELDEHYCDVIIQRWENLTGQTAELISE